MLLYKWDKEPTKLFASVKKAIQNGESTLHAAMNARQHKLKVKLIVVMQKKF